MRRSMSEINVVPYIDVMLVLLIIFMVTAPLVAPGNIELPSVAKSSQTRSAPIEIVVRRNAPMTIRADASGKNPALTSRTVSMNQLVTVIRERQAVDADQPVVIFADKAVPYEAVMKVMDTLQRQSVKRIGLAVQPAP